VSDAELEAMFALTRKLMRANVNPGSAAGASGQIVTYTGLRRTTGRSDPGQRLWVYGRGGQPCRRCGTPIAYRKTGPDARGLYFCPRCQR
jgi:endonuclease-8